MIDMNEIHRRSETILDQYHESPEELQEKYWHQVLRSEEELERDEAAVLRLLETAGQGGEYSNAAQGSRDLASLIDHTLLKPEATGSDIQLLCEEAISHEFATVCVNPVYVPYCVELTEGSGVRVATVVGFPLGANRRMIKADEAAKAVQDGAGELDMVINLGALKSRNYEQVFEDIQAVVQASERVPVKVILETSLLTDEEKVKGSLLASEAGADFVKTSTGFSKGGATVADVTLMRVSVKRNCGVKAAGGIRNKEQALNMLRAGATRIGTSSGISIVE